MRSSLTTSWLAMEFPQRLVALRKERGLTQKALAEQVGVHLTQIQRYEHGAIQPTLDVLRRLAIALSVSADMLVFDHDERGPDEEFRLQFEAVCRLPAEDKQAIRRLLDGMIVKNRAQNMLADIGQSA